MKLPRLFRRSEQAPQTRSYDAATSSPRRFQAGQSRFSAYGPETVAAGPMIRSRARYSAENNALAAAAIAAWTDSAVGPGLMPTSQHPDPAIRTALDTGFRNWAKRADASGRSDFAGIQAAVVRAERIDGEAFVMWQGGKLLHLPPEQLADLTTDTIAAGVELGDDSQAIAFHVHPSRPDGIQATYAPPVRVAASEMLHIFETRGPGQIRGVSALSPVLLTLSELDGLEDALLTQSKVAALLSVILSDQNNITAEDPFTEGQSLEPGAMIRMAGNWKVDAIAPQQTQQAEAFLQHLSRRIAAGVGVPVHLVNANVSDANYSSLRAAMVAYRQRIERYQWQTLVPQFLNPVWNRVATLTALDLGLELDDALFEVEWIAPKQPWVDPQKDSSATISLIENGLMSRRQAVAELGYSIEQLDAEIAADRERETTLGLEFSVPLKEQMESKS
ncbi:phage portal protein [Celeribacter neptunius]|uniref:Phage portal protein, lambda family n=1 Tax=Celeribacter neptunius TaxID=588602 RepID=A0A1I3TRF9_9RHOB|nr:phage portal protein [Celeribacter neptunius]SFJ73848.1 phage portal protein, lambda family [Celeribacter neptunius]